MKRALNITSYVIEEGIVSRNSERYSQNAGYISGSCSLK